MKNSIKKSIFTAVLVATAAASWASKGTTLCIQNTTNDAYILQVNKMVSSEYQSSKPDQLNGASLNGGETKCVHVELESKFGTYYGFDFFAKGSKSTPTTHMIYTSFKDGGWVSTDQATTSGVYIEASQIDEFGGNTTKGSHRGFSCDLGENCSVFKIVDSKDASTVIPGTEKVSSIPGTETLAQN